MKKATCVHFIDRAANTVLFAEQQFKIIGLKGYGGKIEDGESAGDCTVREVMDESGGNKKFRTNPDEEGGIVFDPKDLIPVGCIDFYNGSEEEVPFGDPSFRVLFYNCYVFSGKAIDTVEMRNPQFYPINNLPFEKMVKGDEEFIKPLLEGVCTTGMIRRSSDWKTILQKELDECSVEDLVL